MLQNGISAEEFEDLEQDYHYQTFRIYPSPGGSYAYLINSLTSASGRREEPKAMILVKLDTAAIANLMRMDSSVTWLVDDRGMSIGSDGSEISAELLELVQSQGSGSWNVYESYIRCVDSERTTMQYVNALPEDVYLENVRQMWKLLSIYLLVCLLVGGTLAVWIAKKQYDPVREIMETIRKANLTPKEKGEMEQIKGSINQLITEKANFRQRLESQKRALRSTAMYNLIKGRHLERYLVEGIPYVSGGFNYQGGYLVAFDVEDASRAFFEEHEDLDEDLMDLVFYVVENIAEELLENKYTSFVSEADGIMLCLVNVPEEKKAEAEKELQELAERIIGFMTEKFAVRLSAGISDYHPNWKGIEECYHDIQDLLDYRSVNGTEQSVVCYTEVETFWQEETDAADTLEQQVRSLLQEGAYENAIRLIADQMEVPQSTAMELQSVSVSDQVSSVEMTEDHLESPDYQEEGEAEEEAAAPVETKCSTSEIVCRVQEYIQSNYKDKDLSVGKIADEFGISLSYLSQIFKRAMKTGLLEYIHLQRIEEAKELLIRGQSVQSVAEEVGYYNTRPLIRMFKRLENMTPTEYKEYKKNEVGKEE